jgi:SAM-dependent methyltransferase
MGAGLTGASLRPDLTTRSIDWYGTDLRGDGGQVFALDLENPAASPHRKFATVLCFSVLEHCFDPVKAMDTAASYVAPGGHLVVCTPSVWPLHYYPLDCWRMNPGFLVEYAKRRGLTLLREHLMWVAGGLRRIESDAPDYPPYARTLPRRVAHRILRAVGAPIAGHAFLTVGGVMRRD